MDLAVQHLTKAYGRETVLSGCSFTVPEGGTLCVMGPSGSGKTTLLRLLAGLEVPDSGQIRYPDGSTSDGDRRNGSRSLPFPIGFIFQENRLCPGLDAIGNIRLAAPHLPEDAIAEELEKVGLVGSKEVPLRSRKPVGEYSGGMQRRVAIVRALLAPAPLLLLDEPLKGLDPALLLQVRDYMKTALSGRTAVFVTHNPEEANFFGKELLCL